MIAKSAIVNAWSEDYMTVFPNIMIGVTGADGLTDADFTLSFTLKQ